MLFQQGLVKVSHLEPVTKECLGRPNLMSHFFVVGPWCHSLITLARGACVCVCVCVCVAAVCYGDFCDGSEHDGQNSCV